MEEMKMSDWDAIAERVMGRSVEPMNPACRGLGDFVRPLHKLVEDIESGRHEIVPILFRHRKKGVGR